MGAVLKLTAAEEALLEKLPTGDVAQYLRRQGLPSRRTEEWRWSDLRATLRDPTPISDPYTAEIGATTLELDNPIELVFANGRLVAEPVYLPSQLRLSQQSAHLGTPGTPVAAIAAELVGTSHILEVTGSLAQPILIRYLSDGAGMHQTRLQVRLSPDAEAVIVEHHESNKGSWFANNLCEFSLNSKSRLIRVMVEEGAPEAVGITTALVALGDRARFDQVILGFGGKMVRNETRLVQVQKNAVARLHGAYLLDDNNHYDQTTHVEHRATEGVTEQLCKGVLRDSARGVFQGKFYVAREAQKTDARMRHQALLLSENAEVNAKPELEIYADDVQCAHGNTAGALDEDALFYMRQRGLSEDEARALLVDAFVAEVLDNVQDELLRSQLSGKVQAFMRGDA